MIIIREESCGHEVQHSGLCNDGTSFAYKGGAILGSLCTECGTYNMFATFVRHCEDSEKALAP